MRKREEIKHAAVKSVCGWIFLGKQHGDCFATAHYIGIEMSQKACDQGFVTSKGRYVDRTLALKIAQRAKQTSNRVKGLCSEDIWDESNGGCCDYSTDKGYVIRETKGG